MQHITFELGRLEVAQNHHVSVSEFIQGQVLCQATHNSSGCYGSRAGIITWDKWEKIREQLTIFSNVNFLNVKSISIWMLYNKTKTLGYNIRDQDMMIRTCSILYLLSRYNSANSNVQSGYVHGSVSPCCSTKHIRDIILTCPLNLSSILLFVGSG